MDHDNSGEAKTKDVIQFNQSLRDGNDEINQIKHVLCKKTRFLRNCRLIDWTASKFVMLSKTPSEASRMNSVSASTEKTVTSGSDNSPGHFVHVERVKSPKARLTARPPAR